MASILYHPVASVCRATHLPSHRPVCPGGLSSFSTAIVRLLMRSFKLVRDIGITNGNETRVGFYVGLIVRLHDLSFHSGSLCLLLNAVAFAFLRGGSAHCVVLESIIRPYRPETCHSSRRIRLDCFNVLFRSLPDLLGIDIEVTWCLHVSSLSLLTIPRSFSRALNGALNGNIGVMKSMMVEMTDSTNLAQAYAYMPLAWSSGATLASVLCCH